MKQIDLPLYKFYLIEGMTQEDLNELALERNNLSEEVYRLNNIINELEKWLEEQLMYFIENNAGGGFFTNIEDLSVVADKIKELKGGKE